jgi:DNA-binding winged helix-turn-helix (wHTH) protein/tetratricopeptide (TPR) repeat protein
MATVRRYDTYEFGPFVLEAGNALLHAGEPVRLPPKEFGCLQTLTEGRGAVVTKDELAGRVWGRPDVSDESLSRCIYALRTKLERYGADEVIETVHKRGYRLRGEIRHRPATLAPPGPMLRLAVLPFEAYRPDEDLQWSASGLGEELIAHLGRLHRGSVAVIARGSVAAYAKHPQDLRAAARDLKLDFVVTGRVGLGPGGRLVVRAELVRCRDDVMIWSESVDLGTSRAGDLSPDAARVLARRIPVPAPAPGFSPADAVETTPEAYAEYLQARHLLQKRGGANLLGAVEHYRRAVVLDPRFARAHVGIANCYLFGGLWAALAPHEVVPLAQCEIDAALAIDPELPGALASHGMLLSAYLFRPDDAHPLFRRAIEEMPNDTEAHLMYGRHLMEVGRPRDAVLAFRNAIEFDPQSPNAQMYLAKALHFARDHDAALQQARRAAEIVPAYAVPHAFVSACATGAGPQHYEEALVAARRAVALDPHTPALQWSLTLALALLGNASEVHERIAQEEELQATKFRMPALAVPVACALGDPTLAVKWLRRAAEQRDPWLPLLLRDPRIDALYDCDEFTEAVEELGVGRQKAPQVG